MTASDSRPGGAWVGNTHPGLRRSWHPVARSAEVTAEPTQVWLLGEPWVAYRVHGAVVVLADRCPHRLAPLSAGTLEGNELRCAYHGWRWAPDGSCRSIPSLGEGSRLPPKACVRTPWGVIERYGMVFVAVEQPEVELLEIPVWGDADRYPVELDYRGRYGAALLIDNQLDTTHFAFLHAGTFGSPASARTPAYEVERPGRWDMRMRMPIAIAAANDPGVATGERPLDQERWMTYRYRAPFSLELTLEYPGMGGSNVLVFWVQPETADRARFYITMLFAQPGGFTADELAIRVAFEERVVDQDLAFQIRYPHLDMPLDLTTECHVRADRASVEYRRILTDLLAGGDRDPDPPPVRRAVARP